MKDEIKEILNCMNIVVFYDQGMKLETEQCKILHDYIIDLEEENENLKDFNTKLQATKDRLDKYDRENQMRIDKAVESIKIMKEKNDMYGTKSLSIDINHLETLLNILQGDDNNE